MKCRNLRISEYYFRDQGSTEPLCGWSIAHTQLKYNAAAAFAFASTDDDDEDDHHHHHHHPNEAS